MFNINDKTSVYCLLRWKHKETVWGYSNIDTSGDALVVTYPKQCSVDYVTESKSYFVFQKSVGLGHLLLSIYCMTSRQF